MRKPRAKRGMPAETPRLGLLVLTVTTLGACAMSGPNPGAGGSQCPAWLLDRAPILLDRSVDDDIDDRKVIALNEAGRAAGCW